MKKTLIALAVLVTAGTAFAQSTVNLTGKLRFAYGQSTDAAGIRTTGIGVTDGDWNIAVVEDLGGGLKAGVNMALRLRGRDAATDPLSTGLGARPRDSSMYVTGGFGTVLVGAIDAGNGLLGLATAGGPNYIGLDNDKQLAGSTNIDLLQYTSPTISGFSVNVATFDNVGAGGSQSTAITQDGNLVGLKYANGPLSVSVDATKFGLNAVLAGGVSRSRISANYDLGVARIGAGYQSSKNTGGPLAPSKNETVLSVSAPFGAFQVGAVYATSKSDGVAGNNTGFDLAVQYNLSKRTYVAFQAQSTKGAGVTTSATNNRVQLAHSF